VARSVTRPQRRSAESATTGPRAATAINVVIDETRLLFHRLRAVAEELHGGDGISAGARGVLTSLAAEGPQTVPRMARARPTSRQHIQTIVNSLLEAGLVTTARNPAHKRSVLITLTRPGERLVATMRRREARFLSELALHRGVHQLRAAATVLRDLRRALTERRSFPNRGATGARRTTRRKP
jgi:DNA-binding MarR family transcriptional regulator